MYSTLVKWIGSTTCTAAGNVLDGGSACAGALALNMGLVVLGLIAVGLTAMAINARRRARRDSYYV